MKLLCIPRGALYARYAKPPWHARASYPVHATSGLYAGGSRCQKTGASIWQYPSLDYSAATPQRQGSLHHVFGANLRHVTISERELARHHSAGQLLQRYRLHIHTADSYCSVVCNSLCLRLDRTCMFPAVRNMMPCHPCSRDDTKLIQQYRHQLQHPFWLSANQSVTRLGVEQRPEIPRSESLDPTPTVRLYRMC